MHILLKMTCIAALHGLNDAFNPQPDEGREGSKGSEDVGIISS